MKSVLPFVEPEVLDKEEQELEKGRIRIIAKVVKEEGVWKADEERLKVLNEKEVQDRMREREAQRLEAEAAKEEARRLAAKEEQLL